MSHNLSANGNIYIYITIITLKSNIIKIVDIETNIKR
jgi:hypothetical protein